MVIVRHSRSPRFGRHVDSGGSSRSNVNSSQSLNVEFTNSALSVGEGNIEMGGCHDAMQSSAEVKCPLCRGSVSGWIPAGDVRQYLDKKLRTCSHDSCKFVGTYEQLRGHARAAHALTKPSHVDLSRKRTWDCLEREQEFGDVISAIRSHIPGAIIVGDYVIETGDAMSPDIDSDNSSEEWWSPVRDNQVEDQDDRLASPVHWLNETLGSPNIWSDGRRGLPRLLPQNRGSPRRSFSHRRSSNSDWLGIRRSSSHRLLQQGMPNSHSRHRSSYRVHRGTLFNQTYASRDASNGRSLDDPSSAPRRRQRLRYTHRSQH